MNQILIVSYSGDSSVKIAHGLLSKLAHNGGASLSQLCATIQRKHKRTTKGKYDTPSIRP